jgi:hypothetical protein
MVIELTLYAKEEDTFVTQSKLLRFARMTN